MSDLNQMEEERYRGMREYSRVDAYLPFSVRRVPLVDKDCVRSRMSVESVLTEHPELPEVQDVALSECLRIINSKLDAIIEVLSLQSREHSIMRLQNVNISAGGICVAHEEDFAPEELLEIRLVLPSVPYAVMYVYGLVVKSQPIDDGSITSIEYTEIDEDIREQIAKFVFERQREILRKKKRQ
jgi:hypothetical protein